MIYVRKDARRARAAVAALERPLRDKAVTELADARAYYASVPPPTDAYDFARYKEHAVCVALDHAFNRKCAYCETNYSAADVRDVEHFRPKGGVNEHQPHPGYWWLAAEWSNLLPSCPACNRRRRHVAYDPGMTQAEFELALEQAPTSSTGKGGAFPLRHSNWVMTEAGDLSQEDPLLINPCIRHPERHLEWTFDWPKRRPLWRAGDIMPMVRPRTVNGIADVYGETSIRIYGLNRGELARLRREHLRQLQLLAVPVADQMIELTKGAAASNRAARRRLRDYHANLEKMTHASAPYAGMSRAFVSLFEDKIAEWLTKYAN